MALIKEPRLPDYEIEVLNAPRISTAVDRANIDREDAYRVYITTGARSLRRTADLLGIPHGTVLSWSSRGQWRQRANDTDLEVTEGIADASQAAVVAQQLNNITYLSKLRDDVDAEHKDRTKAVSMLMGEFKDISKAIAMSAEDMDLLEDRELEQLAQSEEGVAQLLARSRARIGAI